MLKMKFKKSCPAYHQTGFLFFYSCECTASFLTAFFFLFLKVVPDILDKPFKKVGTLPAQINDTT